MAYDYKVFEKLCEVHNVTAYRVAQDTGVTTATLSSWKTGRYEPKSDKIQKLAEYFDVSPTIFQSAVKKENVFYLDGESAEIAKQIFKNPDLRLLFKAASDSKVEDIQLATDLLTRMKATNNDG